MLISWAASSTAGHVLMPVMAGLTAFAAVFVLTPAVRLLATRLGLIAKPVEDRWGRRVIARMGGLAMYLGLLLATLIWIPMTQMVAGILVGLTLVFALGMTDDLRRMPPYTKLLFQLLIGCVVVLMGLRIEIPGWRWVSIPVSVLWYVVIMNAFNLLDNMDGLAAGIGAICAAICAWHAVLGQHWVLVALNAILCGTCLGFLRFNFPPAKIFMGDSGSHLIGLALATLTPSRSWYQSTHLISVLAVPALVLAVPIFDTCFVTIQRLLHGRHPFAGGTDHVSHRLAVLGLTERQTVLALYTIALALGVLSVASTVMKPLPTVAVWCVVLAGLVLFGRFLSHVNVYRLQPAAPVASVAAEPMTRIETMLLHKRRLLEILIDFCMISSAYVFAHLLRFEGNLTFYMQQLIAQSLPIILLIKLTSFAGCGLYLRLWRYPDLSDILSILKAVTLGSVLSALTLLYFWRFDGYSRAVFIIDWMLTFLAVAGTRVAERVFNEWILAAAEHGEHVLIVGAGETGERVLRSVKFSRPKRRVVGFVDDDPRKLGVRIHGCPVLGARAQLPRILQAQQVREVLVAITDPPGELVEHVRGCCDAHQVPWKVVNAGVTEIV